MNVRNVSPRGRVTYFDRDQPHAVYWVRDGLDRVIYIGSSHDPAARVAAHCSEKGWWIHEITWTEEWYPDWSAAVRAEHVTIWREDPDLNFVGTALSAITSRARFGPDGAGAANAIIARARRAKIDRIAAEKAGAWDRATSATTELRNIALRLGVPPRRVQQIAEGRSAGGQGGSKTESES